MGNKADTVNDVDFEWLEKIVRQAGDIALQHFRGVTTQRKADNTVVTAADQEVEEFLRKQLTDAFPEDSLLGEEMGTQSGQSDRMWAIDPIDGTASYAAGLPVWGVSVGVLQNREPIAGIFYMPLLDELYLSQGDNATFNGHSIQVDSTHQIDDESFLGVTSGAHRKYRINFVGKTRALGSTAANLCYVARGTAVAALIGRPHLWDIAGTLPILRAAGGDVRLLSGQSVDLTSMTNGRISPAPMLVGTPWSLDYFTQRIEVIA